MNAAVVDLSEYKLHRECQRRAWRLRSGLVALQMRETYTLGPATARALAEAMNDALSRRGNWTVGDWSVRRASISGMVWVQNPFEEMFLRQETAELYALALARAVGP